MEINVFCNSIDYDTLQDNDYVIWNLENVQSIFNSKNNTTY
jgi:hypothetical protein